MLDAVIVHELAHLIEPNHSSRFDELERRYPRRAEADVFLEGYALGLHMPKAACQDDLSDDGDEPRSAEGSPLQVLSGPPSG